MGDEAEATWLDELDDFSRAQAILAELKRRYPSEDWGEGQPCPQCGSFEHFEC